MRLGQDISDKQSIQNFNNHYFKRQDSLFEAQARVKVTSKTPHYQGAKGLEMHWPEPAPVNHQLNKGLPGQQSVTSIGTVATIVNNPMHTKTVHQDFGQVIKEDIVEEDLFLQQMTDA